MAPALGTNLASMTRNSKMLQGATLFSDGHMPDTCSDDDGPPVVFNSVTKEPFPEASCNESADGNKLVLTPSILRISRDDGLRERINLRKFARARERPGADSVGFEADTVESCVLVATEETFVSGSGR